MGHAGRLHLSLPLNVLKFLTSIQENHDLQATIDPQKDVNCQLKILKDEEKLHIVLTAPDSHHVLEFSDDTFSCHVHKLCELDDAEISEIKSENEEQSDVFSLHTEHDSVPSPSNNDRNLTKSLKHLGSSSHHGSERNNVELARTSTRDGSASGSESIDICDLSSGEERELQRFVRSHLTSQHGATLTMKVKSPAEQSKQPQTIKHGLDMWWKCDFCGKYLTSETAFQRHLKIKHKAITERASVWLHCGVCGKKFLNSRSVKRHIRRKHRKECHSIHESLSNSLGGDSFMNTSEEALKDDMLMSAISDEVFPDSPQKTPLKLQASHSEGAKPSEDIISPRTSGMSTRHHATGFVGSDMQEHVGTSRALSFTPHVDTEDDTKPPLDHGCNSCGNCDVTLSNFTDFYQHMHIKHNVKFIDECDVKVRKLHMEEVGLIRLVAIKEERPELGVEHHDNLTNDAATDELFAGETATTTNGIEVKVEVDQTISEVQIPARSTQEPEIISSANVGSLVEDSERSARLDDEVVTMDTTQSTNDRFCPILSDVVSLAIVHGQEEVATISGDLSSVKQHCRSGKETHNHRETVACDRKTARIAASTVDTFDDEDYDFQVLRVDEVQDGSISQSCAHCGSVLTVISKEDTSTDKRENEVGTFESKQQVERHSEVPVKKGGISELSAVSEEEDSQLVDVGKLELIDETSITLDVLPDKTTKVSQIESEIPVRYSPSLSCEKVQETSPTATTGTDTADGVANEVDDAVANEVDDGVANDVDDGVANEVDDADEDQPLQNVTNMPPSSPDFTVQDKQKEPKTISRPRVRQMPFICPKCDQLFRTAQHIRQHMTNKHIAEVSKKTIECIIEDQQAYGNQNLSDSAKIQCPFCERSRPGKAILKHLKIWHVDVVSDDVLRTIKVKLKELKIRNFNNGKASEAPKVVTYKCEFCEEVFETKPKLVVHKKYKCSDNPKSSLKCKRCEYEGESYEDLKRHRGKHYKASEEQAWVCERCGNRYKHRSGLEAHRVSKHYEEVEVQGKKWECDLCKRLFNYKRVYLRHLFSHSNVREAVCDLCGKSYKTLEDLRVHKKRIHYHLYPYHCQYCGHGVQRQKSLRTHRCGQVRSHKSQTYNATDEGVGEGSGEGEDEGVLLAPKKQVKRKGGKKVVKKKSKIPVVPVGAIELPVITQWDAGESVATVLAEDDASNYDMLSSAILSSSDVNTSVASQTVDPMVSHEGLNALDDAGADAAEAMDSGDGFVELNRDASNANELMIMYTRLQAGDLELLSS